MSNVRQMTHLGSFETGIIVNFPPEIKIVSGKGVGENVKQ